MLHHRSVEMLLPRAAYARAGLSLSNWFVCHNFFLKTRSNRRFRGSKQQDNDEMCQILAYEYLVEHKAVLFSAFPTFF